MFGWDLFWLLRKIESGEGLVSLGTTIVCISEECWGGVYSQLGVSVKINYKRLSGS